QSHAGQSHAGQSHAGQSHAGQSHAGKSVVLKVPTRAIGWPHSSLTTWLAISVAFGVGVVVGRGSTPTEPAAAEVVRSVELESAPIPRFESAGAAFIFGLAALDRGRYQTAVEALEQAVDHNPALAMAHRRLGDALLAQRRFEAAATSYKMFLTLKPNTPDADVLRVLLNDLSQSSTAPEAR
ncbi:MAG: tetratricopeptide repeat protein, partial [Myxococcota bacterium]